MTTTAPLDFRAPRYAILVGTVGSAAVAGALVAVHPMLAALGLVVVAVTVAVWCRPVAAALLTISITPLVAGIDRGRLVPMLRPNEALVALLAAILVARALVRLRPGQRLTFKLSRLELALVLMAVANSILPIVWMLVRGRVVEADDISYALVLWKYLAVYAVIRATVHTDNAVRWCLWASVLSASLVGVIGILQALDLSAAFTRGERLFPRDLAVGERERGDLAVVLAFEHERAVSDGRGVAAQAQDRHAGTI
jgi:hypothetical protein